jgi:hypothetical protein
LAYLYGGTVEISGSFVLPQGMSLGQLIDPATVVSLTDLLEEVGGRGELSMNPTTAHHLPATLLGHAHI